KVGTDIVNVANQEWADSEGEEGKHITEKRVNKVETPSIPKQVVQKVLPQTGDSPSTLAIKIGGLLLVAGAGFYFYRRRQEQLLLKSLFDSKELQNQSPLDDKNN
uniref:LPXTG cell wall anchor domain-containing protein n=1 Tax=uncultured Vagococcus sp. TaxID=189676 RepID=UPI002590CA55